MYRRLFLSFARAHYFYLCNRRTLKYLRFYPFITTALFLRESLAGFRMLSLKIPLFLQWFFKNALSSILRSRYMMDNYLIYLNKIRLTYNAIDIRFHMQADYIGRTILSKLLNEWRLLDELGLLRAIYLLGSGTTIWPFQNFVTHEDWPIYRKTQWSSFSYSSLWFVFSYEHSFQLVQHVGKQTSVDFVIIRLNPKGNSFYNYPHLLFISYRPGILLYPGDLLQHFLTVIFNKLNKGESLDDDFELNTILQVQFLSSSSSRPGLLDVKVWENTFLVL